MSIEVTTKNDIARPLAEVAAYAFDPSHAPDWYANIKSVRWRTAPPVADTYVHTLPPSPVAVVCPGWTSMPDSAAASDWVTTAHGSAATATPCAVASADADAS